MIYKEIIIDADLCLKLGSSQKYPYLQTLLPLLADTIYIHEVVNGEIKTDRAQIDSLIKSGKVKILTEAELSSNELTGYIATYNKLGRVMLNANNPNKNRGEVCSLAMAKTKGIHYFASDEKKVNLQDIIDQLLNTGMDDITCVRIQDIINLIKDGKLSDMTRKDARLIWIISGKDKAFFDSKIWPFEP